MENENKIIIDSIHDAVSEIDKFKSMTVKGNVVSDDGAMDLADISAFDILGKENRASMMNGLSMMRTILEAYAGRIVMSDK